MTMAIDQPHVSNHMGGLAGAYLSCFIFQILLIVLLMLKGIVSPDWKGLQMVSLDRFEV
jgi:hypothetical protein